MEWNDIHKKVFSEYARYIVHMRNEFQADRFGLVFGAGVSKPLGGPTWKELNTLVAKDTSVQGEKFCSQQESEPVVTQRLYEHYKLKHLPTCVLTSHGEIKQELTILRDFNRIVYKHLYSNSKVPLREDKIKDNHTYLANYLKILLNYKLTVNYNFDDYIQRLISQERPEEEKSKTRGFETVTDISIPFRRNTRVIYHPNGILPTERMETGTKLVFSENEFANQLIGVTTGHYSSLIHHYLTNTCLFVGISLNDPTLKHIMKLVVRINPGRCHYYVQYYDKKEGDFDLEQKNAIFAANFETYNLITLFLCDEEIAALGDLIGSGYKEEHQDSDISRLANMTHKPLKYCYYFVGAIGVGKSTTIARFRDLVTFDEWFELRESDLGKEPESLSLPRISTIDRWIARQFTLKNHEIYQVTSGIMLADRCPLDPISFTPYEKWQEKAKFLLKTILRENKEIVRGHIILLLDDPAVLELRLITSAKEYTENRLRRLQEDIERIYCMEGVSKVDAKYMTSHEMIKKVAKIIYAEDYIDIDVQKELEKIEKGEAECLKKKD